MNNAYLLFTNSSKNFAVYLNFKNKDDVITALVQILGKPIAFGTVGDVKTTSKIYDYYNWEINNLDIHLNTKRPFFNKDYHPDDIVLVITNMHYKDIFIFNAPL